MLFQVETKREFDDDWVICVPEMDVVPAGWDRYNVLRCKDNNTIAKHIKITAMNPMKSRKWVFVLIEVRVFGTDGFSFVDDVIEELLDEIF